MLRERSAGTNDKDSSDNPYPGTLCLGNFDPRMQTTELSGPTFELVDVSPDEFCDELRTLHPNWVSSRYLGQDDTYH